MKANFVKFDCECLGIITSPECDGPSQRIILQSCDNYNELCCFENESMYGNKAFTPLSMEDFAHIIFLIQSTISKGEIGRDFANLIAQTKWKSQ